MAPGHAGRVGQFAADRCAVQDVDGARAVGEQVLAVSRVVLGREHSTTIDRALSLDRINTG
jgi:hypothetical protein